MSDCIAKVAGAAPSGCATATCQAGACVFTAKDADGDGHGTATCVATGVTIVLGDDCDDGDPNTYPTAWDGPAGDGHPDRCDGKDNDCKGGADEGKLANGTTCTCAPGDVKPCSETSSGVPITFPKLVGGKPVGICKLGALTCGTDGKWSACVGAVPPLPFDTCNGGLDDDCDGAADIDDDVKPPNLTTWTYDGDGDNVASSQLAAEVVVQACPDKAPAQCPASIPGCDLKQWKSVALATVDCDDTNAAVNPSAVDKCDGVDNNCSGAIDENYVDKGAACSNNLKGACHIDGAMVCNGLGTATVCETAPPFADVPATDLGGPLHGSCDRDCDGTVTIDLGGRYGSYPAAEPVDVDCTNVPPALTLCHPGQMMSANVFYLCQKTTAIDPTWPPEVIATVSGQKFGPACGSSMLMVHCFCTISGCTTATSEVFVPTWK